MNETYLSLKAKRLARLLLLLKGERIIRATETTASKGRPGTSTARRVIGGRGDVVVDDLLATLEHVPELLQLDCGIEIVSALLGGTDKTGGLWSEISDQDSETTQVVSCRELVSIADFQRPIATQAGRSVYYTQVWSREALIALQQILCGLATNLVRRAQRRTNGNRIEVTDLFTQ